MHPQRLHNRIADRLTRIKRGVRILKNKLNIAPQSLQLAAGEGIDPLTVEGNGASLGLYQPQQRPAGGRLAAAGLAHQRQGLSRPEIKTDLLHRMHFARHAIEQPAAHRKTGHQVTHLQDRLAGDYRIGRFALRQRLARQRKTARQILATHLPQPRDRRQQRLRIRVLRRTKDLLNAAGLYRLTAIHHQHPIGDIGHDAHIVGDKDHPIAISFCRTAMSCRICAWMVTSSAVVGSSAINTAGRQESAMAIITLWRMPPESWCG